ncbi:hypothetical protein AB2T63_12205 [Clostridium butyricum]|uniref:Uncharacterized protein n=1 Tax=Clostridium butyricum TaxID=1492 RepID=A0A2S7FCR5_CLOBU|nr:hypothetical protein [Clostridium butyricum]KHD14968.1 hypothetical protein OA81_12780 [Clostridium butyricum]PPV16033.1 hypothetical protein AWN73_10815 [Clostridium butyricum]
MITQFKNKEELAAERKVRLEISTEQMLKEKPGLQTERFIRMLKGKMQGNDRLYISNSLIKVKRSLIKRYKELDYYYSEIRAAKRIIESDVAEKYKIESEAYIKSIKDIISKIEDYIMSCGEGLIDAYIPLIDKYFSEQEIIQLLSGSYSQAKRIKEFYNKKETGTRSLTDSFIIHHVEYRWRKGRSRDFIDCPDWEMPLFNCISTYMWKAINENPKARADMDNVLEELFEDAMISTTFDSEGNVISAEKVIQELTQNELIRGYQGAFINELKQKNILDNETTYKLKRADKGVYCVVGEDKEIIATIYKKIS